MKKTISLLLCAAMTAGVLSGCRQKDTASETVRTENQEQENTNGAAGQAPKAEEPADNKDAAVIRCGITVSQNSLPAEALEVFNESLKKATDGTVRLEVFYDGTMGNERDVIEGVSMGTIEMYAGSTAPLANFVDDFNIWDLPYMVDMNKLEDAYAIMDGAIGQKMLDSLSSIGTKGLAISHQGFRCMLNGKKEVTKPADAKNLVIRTMENDIHLEFYREIGANPVAMASTEAFTALAQGTIDGMDNILDAFYTQGAFESAKYLTMTGHIISGYVFLINEDVFNSLTEQQQAAVQQAGKDAAVFMRNRAMEKMDEIAEIARDEYGVTVTQVDTQEWKDASAKVAEKYKGGIDTEYWNAFYE